MNILFIGDIVGKPGRQAVKSLLPELKIKYELDLVIANGENMAGGLGMTMPTYEEMIEAGIDFFTSGNHIFRKEDFAIRLNDENIKVIRPINYPEGTPGRGYAILEKDGKKILLINVIGRAFFDEMFTDPYKAVDLTLKKEKADIIIVDHHAEATSNKAILAYYLDGQVTAVLGTHTHVPTADARILPKGTAFITDVGMVGVLNSSLGGDLESFTKAELLNIPAHYRVAKDGPVVFNAVLLKIMDNKAKSIELIRIIK
jgi:metallophosphoesterase (TIGR00282 family)